MKKLFSILLITLTALTANMFDAGAQNYDTTPEAGKVKFKIIFVDRDEQIPVYGASIDMKITPVNNTRQDLIRILHSDHYGVTCSSVDYSTGSDTYGTYGVFPGITGNIYTGNPSASVIDCDPCAPFRYRTDYSDGRIRRVLNSERGGASYNVTIVPNPNFGGFDNCYLSGNWLTEGAVIEYKIWVDPGENRTFSKISFNTTGVSNASAFKTFKAMTGTTVAEPSVVPISTDANKMFRYWSADGGVTRFDFSATHINSNITLTPVWVNNPDPNAQGKIKFKVFMWDHDAYMGSPKIYKYGQGYTHTITRSNGNSVQSNFDLADYQTNAGWTDTKVCNLRFTVRTYPHKPGVPENPSQIGEITTDENGEATLTLTRSELNELHTNYIIDADPDPTSLGYIDMETELGTERLYCVFNYDWMSIADVQNAGLVGVRYIPEGTRHNNEGIQLGDWNDNDAMRITEDDKYDGFEFTFVCYVLPAPCAQFDVNGGTMPAGYNTGLYPQQRFEPINSAGVDVDPWIVEDPCTGTGATGPTPPASPAGMVFEGWHEVRTTLLGAEYVDPKPYVFGNKIKRSVVLRAIYGIPEQEYTVRWAPEGWTGNDGQLYEKTEHHKDGSDATYNAQLPTSSGKTFIGWDMYKKVEGGTTSFGSLGGYEFQSTIYQPQQGDPIASHMIYIKTSSGNFWLSPISVTSDQIYVAKFEIIQTITVVKSGLEEGDSAIFTLTKGADSRQIVLTNTGSGTASETVQVSTGTWTVTEDMDWTWAYTNSESSKQVTVNSGDQMTVTFTNTSKSTTPKHGESNAVNTFNK